MLPQSRASSTSPRRSASTSSASICTISSMPTKMRRLFDRIDQLLGLAAARGITTMPVIFDSVWHPFPVYGPQREPEAGVHNAGWVQSAWSRRSCAMRRALRGSKGTCARSLAGGLDQLTRREILPRTFG